MEQTNPLIEALQDDKVSPSVQSKCPTTRRRSRMHRVSVNKRIELTARDIEIFRLLDRYRYLRSTFLHAFLGGNRTRFIERLGDLYHEGYLGRPAQQWQFANCRYMPAIYELDSKGEHILREYGYVDNESPLLGRRREGARRHFAHQLMIADILSSIELGVRENASLRFIGWREILSRAPRATRELANPFRIAVSFSYTAPRARRSQRVSSALVPDSLFGLEYDTDGAKAYRFFALEADRARMPVVRGDPHQTSYLKKLLAYREITARGAFRSHFGLPNFLVITVTSSDVHMRTIMSCLADVTAGKGSTLFLFKTLSTLGDFQKAPRPAPEILTAPWERVGHPPIRIDKA